MKKYREKYINARNNKLYNFREGLNFEMCHYNHINHRSKFNCQFLFTFMLHFSHQILFFSSDDLLEDTRRWMVRIIDIMFRVLPLVKILFGVYKVYTNYITSTHISINCKYWDVISKIRTVYLPTSPRRSCFQTRKF